MKRYLVFVLVLFMPFYANAEVKWYGGIGAGQMIVLDGIKQPSSVKQIVSIPGVMSSESIEDKTTYKSFFIRRCSNENFCVDGGYLWGAHFAMSTSINNVNVGVVNIGGSAVDFGTLPTTLVLQHEADVSAIQLSALWKVPVSEYVDVFWRGGLYGYSIETTAKILLPGTSIFLAEESEARGTVPMVSIGFNTKLSKKLTFQVEGQKTGVISAVSALFVYDLK